LLDGGIYGVKYLNNPKIADICKYTLHYPDKKNYNLICYCIMPNHIHLVFELLHKNKGISKIMQSIKRVSARKSNLILNRKGKFWQDESYDRLVRDDKELYFIIKYVLMNPVNAGLTNDWSNWKHLYCRPEYIVL
jgi:REP element-mobilizing transposase RayT